MLAFATASLWLAWLAGGVLHFAMVPHVFCAEHGEFIDADVDDVDGEVGSPAESSPELAATSAVAIDTAKSHQRHSHEHCLLSATGRRQVASLVSPPGAIVVVWLSTGFASANEEQHPLLQLFRLAPKHSPPT
jgi:hypothetical protein